LDSTHELASRDLDEDDGPGVSPAKMAQHIIDQAKQLEYNLESSRFQVGSIGQENVLSKPHAHSHSHGNLNIRGVFLHVAGDALGSIVVIVSALVMWLTTWEAKWVVDPLLRYVKTIKAVPWY